MFCDPATSCDPATLFDPVRLCSRCFGGAGRWLAHRRPDRERNREKCIMRCGMARVLAHCAKTAVREREVPRLASAKTNHFVAFFELFYRHVLVSSEDVLIR